MTGITLGGAPLITQIEWTPFAGAVKRWRWAMAAGPKANERYFDLAGRAIRYPLGDALRDVRYDEASRIVSFTHLSADGTAQPALDQAFSYDENDRITGITTNAASWAIAYDPNGNRTGLGLNGSLSAYTVEATSNRVTGTTNPARSFGYDSAGNTTQDSAAGGTGYAATYNLRGQLATLTKAGVTTRYTYNAAGQRVRKVSSTGPDSTVVFVYDQAGHLLGEYDRNGAALREYVWLRDTPMAMFTPDPANPSGGPLVYFIHSDHLNTPRVVVDRNNQVRWRWLGEPFGTSAPETNPSGLGVFTQNLRFPGQYADQESGLFYNYHRYYAAEGGQYTQSDPIGLAGGSLTTYGYVGGNPLSFVDAQGLQLAPSPFGPVPIPLPGLPTQSVIDPGRYDPVQDRYIPGTGSQPNTQECCTAYEDVYETNDGKHGDIPRGDISAEPANPTLALTHSVGAGRSRIGYDGLAGQIVVFRLTRTDEQKCIKYWHGYVVYQRDLTPQQWKAGRDAGFPNWPRKPK